MPKAKAPLAQQEAAVHLPPLPKKLRPHVVEPSVANGGPQYETTTADDASLPKPTGAASGGDSQRGPATPDGAGDVSKATALPNGVALPPLDAPDAVMQIIRAGNTIARTPYKWGGGHGRWKDNGYDCSGSVAYALNAGGLIPGPATSGQLMHWGKPGPGKWVTVYANGGHVFMVVAGIRFDTSGTSTTGSRWQNEMRPTKGFAVRHPSGL